MTFFKLLRSYEYRMFGRISTAEIAAHICVCRWKVEVRDNVEPEAVLSWPGMSASVRSEVRFRLVRAIDRLSDLSTGFKPRVWSLCLSFRSSLESCDITVLMTDSQEGSEVTSSVNGSKMEERGDEAIVSSTGISSET